MPIYKDNFLLRYNQYANLKYIFLSRFWLERSKIYFLPEKETSQGFYLRRSRFISLLDFL